MSKHKSTKAFTRLLKEVKLHKTLTNQNLQWLLRSFLVDSRQQQGGFVLPTVVLLLLVVSLTVGALLVRSFSRTNQVIGERQQQQIFNAATPAIDRARAKLEYLFNDKDYPGGVPSEDFLVKMMGDPEPYTLPDERPAKGGNRLDLNGDGALDNAWTYKDEDGNIVAYSILMDTEEKVGTDTVGFKSPVEKKADAMVVRVGPINPVQPNSDCQLQDYAGNFALEQGWARDSTNTSILRKNFQINAVVLNPKSNASNKVAATLEVQQDRRLERGNRWSAYFRNDLEIFPGPAFTLNGAMYTEGNLFLGSTAFTSYLISSPSSCLYGTDGLDASEISINQTVDPDTGNTTFQGQVVSGSMKNNTFDTDSSGIHRSPSSSTQLKAVEDSVLSSVANPALIALDPLLLFTANESRSRNVSDPTNTTIRDTTNWDTNNPLVKDDTRRIFNRRVSTPYLDDTYRADNRYGPKIPKNGLPTGKKAGAPIQPGDFTIDPTEYKKLVSNTPIDGTPELVGLDGYWERRALNEGIRVIVGQRLELGTPLLVPATPAVRPHENLQRRTLKDNVAAVQATAIYHYQEKEDITEPSSPPLDFPVACLATTVHPGTNETLRRSATFEEIPFKNSTGTDVKLFNDFFTGRGTNGWEYEVPDRATFGTTLDNPSSALRKALKNLATFAGDPDGAYPPKQEASRVHPYPELTKWGDYSNLRRAVNNLSSGYSNLSIADKSYLQTAACSLGMLAHNIKALQDFNYVQNASLLSPVNTVISGTATTPEQAIASLANPAQANLARLVYLKEQVRRDRLNGIGYVCGIPTSYAQLRAKLCAIIPKYEALYYIFPILPHAEIGTRASDTYISAINVGTNLYQAISDTDIDSIKLNPKSQTTIGSWQTKPVNVTTNTDPINGGTYGASAVVPNHKQNELIRYRAGTTVNSVYRVPFKDTALFNGREMMNVRVLNMDLDLLRRFKPDPSPLPTAPEPVDTWIPKSGIIYAFREDAVREDAIARPAIGLWSNYKLQWNNAPFGPPDAWLMDARPSSPKDPPLNADTGISPKPIDYYPDPDRRPYGFRLKNGSNIKREPASGGADNTNGISFLSDNPVYIQGNFNLHQKAGGTLIEEFTQKLPATWNMTNFYVDRKTLDPDFAKKDQDSWLATEILADAVTILSDNFCDGSVEDGILTAGIDAPTVGRGRYGCGDFNGLTSYLNQNRPNTAATWLRENLSDPASPIVISPSGAPVPITGSYNAANFYPFTQEKQRINAQETRVNAMIISGIVPSRAQQSYGGLHNFPRFLENWEDPAVNLYIAGSFIQLYFSTSATGPFDHDAWERPSMPTGTETIKYYRPPGRRWGYDVGLQFKPAGAVSKRFTVPTSPRSEFYKELPVDDPYILKLRCAKDVDGKVVDLNATCP